MKTVEEILREMTARERERLCAAIEKYRRQEAPQIEVRLLVDLVKAIEKL